MDIWMKYPNYSRDDLRLLVRAAAAVLYDTAANKEQLDAGVLDMSRRVASKNLARDLQLSQIDRRTEQIEAFLTNERASESACLEALAEIRKYPELAKRVAEAYDGLKNRMTGIETLLAGALLLLAIRVKKVTLPGGGEVDFYESADAVKNALVRLT